MVASWVRWERAQVAAHWRDDARRGFALGLWLGGILVAWLGLR